MKGYPRWFVPLLITAAIIVFMSGLLLAPSFTDRVWQLELGWRASGAIRILTSASHVMTGFIIVACLGALLPIHIRAGWARRVNHLSGLLCVVALLVLAVGGVGVLYLGDETLIAVNSTAHFALGLLFFLVATVHMINGFRIRLANK